MSFLNFLRGKKRVDPDLAVPVRLRNAGSNLSKPHPLEFFLYLPSESAAQEVAKRGSQLAFTAEVKPAAQGDDWLCFATGNGFRTGCSAKDST
jgi:hypothetical protein